MWASFHHPDFSLPVVARRSGEEVLELLTGLGEVLATGGRPYLLRRWYPTDQAYKQAQWRLRKKGFVAYVRQRDGRPILRATPTAAGQIHPVARPEKAWNRRWNGIWYLLTYDVPEKHAAYRMSLRRFLRQLRMGCLKESTWITPRDIRPDFDDLARAGGAGDYAVLFEARTVLGMSPTEIVQMAWPVDRLHRIQQWYCVEAERLLRRLRSEGIRREQISDFAFEEQRVFHSAMALDPLLPRSLWPSEYLGERVLDRHRAILKTLRGLLRGTGR